MKKAQRKLALALLLMLVFTINICPAEADTAAVPISAEIQSSPVDFEITESVTMAYSGSGNDLTISDIVITNSKAEGMNLLIESIEVDPIMGWSLVPEATDFAKALNKKQFAILSGSHDFSGGVLSDAGTVEEGQSMTLSFTGKAGAFSSKVSEKAANIVVTISLEEALKLVSWAEGTDKEIVAMIEAHKNGKINLYDYWNVGDERTISLSAGSAYGSIPAQPAQPQIFVLTQKGGKTLSDGSECIFQVDMKNLFFTSSPMHSTLVVGNWQDMQLRTWCNSIIPTMLPETIRGIFRPCKNVSGTNQGSGALITTTDTFAVRAQVEICGLVYDSYSGEGSQIEYYLTKENQAKYQNGTNMHYWNRSGSSEEYYRFTASSKASYFDGGIINIGPTGATKITTSLPFSVFGCI